MRKQKQVQLQQVYPQKQSSFQMTNPMRKKGSQVTSIQQQQRKMGSVGQQQQRKMRSVGQQQQQEARRITLDQMQQSQTRKALSLMQNSKQQQQQRRQQIRTLLSDLRNLNPKYYWEGLGVGRSGYAPTLPIASQILFELSNRPQLNQAHIAQINSILQQKTEDDALIKVGRSPAFGSKYRTFDDFLKSRQRRQLYQQMIDM